MLYAFSARYYQFFQKLMTLPAKPLPEQKFQTTIHLDKLRFIETSALPPIIDRWRSHNDIDRNCIIEVVFTFDAALLKLSHIAGFWECNNSFVSMVQPVYPS
jgi:hypothetical protein